MNKRVIGLSIVVVGMLVGGGVFYYQNYLAPYARQKAVSHRFLASVYDEKTPASDIRSQLTNDLQIQKTDDELKLPEGAGQKINTITYDKFEENGPNSMYVSGSMKSKPTIKDAPKDLYSNTFALRLAKTAGKWKVDAFLVQ